MNTDLFAAITDDDEEDAIAELLTDLEAPNDAGLTPLQHACSVGAWKCAEALLGAGAAPVIPAALILAQDGELEPGDGSMLIAAIDAGAPRLAMCLLETGARIDGVTKVGWSALHYAALRGHAEVCGALLDRGLPIDARTAKGETPLAMAVASRGRSIAAIELLVARGADVGVVDNEGKALGDKIRTGVPEHRRAILAAIGARAAPQGPDRSADSLARIRQYIGMRVSAALDGALFGHVPATFWFVFDEPEAMKRSIRDDHEDETRDWNWSELVPVAAVHSPADGDRIAWLFLDWRKGGEPTVQVHTSEAFGHPRTLGDLGDLGLEVVGRE